MKITIFLLILTGFLGLAPATAKAIVVTNEELKFSYVSEDGTFSLECKHWKTVQDIPEWEVLCGKGGPVRKSFRAHFIVEEPTKGKLSYYLIVTDRTQGNVQFKSHAATLNFKGSAPVNSLTLEQGVDQDAALLRMEYTRL